MKYILIVICLIATNLAWAASTQQKLYQAAEDGDLAGVRKALKAGANVDKQDPDGWTALLYAASKNQQPVVQLLISAGADPNIAGDKGETPLVGAVLTQNAPLVKLLLDAGADAGATLADGRSALDVARARGAQDIIQLLGGSPPPAAGEAPSPERQDQAATNPTAQKNPTVSIEEMQQLVPEWARPDISDKTLEYMKHVAETWPLGKGSEAVVEIKSVAGAAKGYVSTKKTVTTPVLPGIVKQEVSSSFPSNSNHTGLLVGWGLELASTGGSSDSIVKITSKGIANVTSYEGQLFPLRIGNSEKLSSISLLQVISKSERMGEQEDESEIKCDSTFTVIDQFDGRTITDFPIPLEGIVFVIGDDFICLSNIEGHEKSQLTRLVYYSDKLNSFIPIQRSEDKHLTPTATVKTLNYRIIN